MRPLIFTSALVCWQLRGGRLNFRAITLEKSGALRLPICLRVLPLSLFVLLSVADLAWSQATGAQPQFRPALIGNGPKALVNVINTKRLVDKGQRDGVLMFTCYVSPSGKVWNNIIYRDRSC